MNQPISYLYDNLRSHAKSRGIEFFLTKEEFKKFCEDTGYHLHKGREPHSYTIDREDSDGPYAIGNIKILSHADNSWKSARPVEEWEQHVAEEKMEKVAAQGPVAALRDFVMGANYAFANGNPF